MFLFLDIDGVMVPARGWKVPEFLSDGFPAFSNKASHALQQFLSAEDTVMLTTSHKANFSIEEWKAIFRNRGVNIEKLLTLPENTAHLSRFEELMNWFWENPVEEDFVIIDDDTSLNGLPALLKKNLIQTSPYIGLTEAHLEEARVILAEKVQSV